MKRKIISILAFSLLIVMILSINCFASSGSGTVHVGTNSVMMLAVNGATRTGNYSYVSVKIKSVYPDYDTEDNYTQCYTRLYQNDSTNTPISDRKILTEGAGYTSVTIYEGKQNLKKFNINFAGHQPSLGAYIVYEYNGN